jgi:hypothetical protein
MKSGSIKKKHEPRQSRKKKQLYDCTQRDASESVRNLQRGKQFLEFIHTKGCKTRSDIILAIEEFLGEQLYSDHLTLFLQMLCDIDPELDEIINSALKESL